MSGGERVAVEWAALVDEECIERTIDACAWLLPVAELCVSMGEDPAVVAWLEKLGAGLFELQQLGATGGLGPH